MVATEEAGRIRAFAESLDAGEITLDASAAVLQDRLALPMQRVAKYRLVLDGLSTEGVSAQVAAFVVHAALAAAERVRADAPIVEVARTGPSSLGFAARTTGAVSRSIVEGSRSSLLLVGYSVTVDPERTGLAARTLDAIAKAAARGVAVTAVLHRDQKNRDALLRSWPGYARRPSVFTWPVDPSDEMTKLHAKVLVADVSDALVTSANLTYHGMEANIELGLRVQGDPARLVEQHFRDLIRSGELVTWD